MTKKWNWIRHALEESNARKATGRYKWQSPQMNWMDALRSHEAHFIATIRAHHFPEPLRACNEAT